MVELVVFLVLAFAAVLVISIVGSVLGAVLGLLVLPFQLFGFLLKGIGFLIALPFLILAAVVGAFVFGAGILVLLSPLLPLVIVGGALWLLLRRRRHTATA